VVITIGGSGGAIFTMPALLLASDGVATLALAYFGVEHLPHELKRIPLEYFRRAITWLANSRDICPGAIGVLPAVPVGGSWHSSLAQRIRR